METLEHFGAFCFCTVIGWCGSLAIPVDTPFGVSQLSELTGAVGGGVVAAHFGDQSFFSAYCVGLSIFFFVHRFLPIVLSESLFKESSHNRFNAPNPSFKRGIEMTAVGR